MPIVTGLSGNEIYCLGLKDFTPGEIVVGNSVVSLGLGGAFSAFGRTISGGEIEQVTSLISEGRHLAVEKLEAEAKAHGASGVTGVVSELKTLSGYTEFIAQGSGVHSQQPRTFFSTAASGVELYCHLDAGYRPIKFVMGNVAYAMGIGRGVMGSLRTLAQGEVVEFSQMYNDIRHVAVQRLMREASDVGANAVVDIKVSIQPYGPGTVELLLTGTASHHPALARGPAATEGVVTSELSGEELWNLASMGYAPRRLLIATSVYSLGMVGGLTAVLRSINRGELPQLTELIYSARENCLELMRKDAAKIGCDQVIGNRLMIKELSPGLIEIMAIGTAIQKLDGVAPESMVLIPQAVIVDKDLLPSAQMRDQPEPRPGEQIQLSPLGCLVMLGSLILTGLGMLAVYLFKP